MSNIIASATGTITEIEKGERGAIERPRSWGAIADGSSIQSGTDGEKYIDIVLYGAEWYQCIKSFTKGDGILPTNTIYFTKITDYQRLATNLFLAKTAYIENLGVMNIKITDDGTENGNVLLQADKDGIICNSGTFNSISVNNASLENVTISGSFHSPFGLVAVDEENKFTDNLALAPGNSIINLTITKVGADQIGRLVRFLKYKWGGAVQVGGIHLKLPDGYYFYENGIKKSSIDVGSECVSLLGLGDNGTFYGWLVLGRAEVCSTRKRGANKRILAFGQVKGTPTGATFNWYKTFDNKELSVARNNVGVYTITLPSSWYGTNYHVILTGVGFVYGAEDGILSSRSVAKASVMSTTNTSITVWVSDDETNNDGSFNFEISSLENFENGEPSEQ